MLQTSPALILYTQVDSLISLSLLSFDFLLFFFDKQQKTQTHLNRFPQNLVEG